MTQTDAALDVVAALEAARATWHEELDTEREGQDEYHFSDLTGCPRETFLRLRGDPQYPMPRFIIGHAVERYIAEYLADYLEGAGPFEVRRSRVIEWGGLVGHLDIEILGRREADGTVPVLMVIDPTTTARKEPDANDGHTLKTAAYAYAVGAPQFAEWVFKLGFDGGRIDVLADKLHVFQTADFEATILERKAMLDLLREGAVPPEEPPPWAEWKCKSYCNAATCSLNGKHK